MKKTISFLLAVLLAFAFPASAAAKDSAITLNKPVTVTVGIDRPVSRAFTADRTDVYALEYQADNLSVSFIGIRKTAPESPIIPIGMMNLTAQDSEKKTMYFCLSKGATVYVVAENAKEMLPGSMVPYTPEDQAVITYTVKRANLPALQTGGTYTVTQTTTYYAIFPEKNARYNFRSQAKKDLYASIELFDENGEIGRGNTSGDENSAKRFDLSADLQAGAAYYAEVTSISEADADTAVRYSFTVSDGAKIAAEQLIPEESTVYMPLNSNNVYSVQVRPRGAVASAADFTVTSSKPRVARVTDASVIDGTIRLETEARWFGKTVIHVEMKNGVSTDMTVRVQPRLLLILHEVFRFFTF